MTGVPDTEVSVDTIVQSREVCQSGGMVRVAKHRRSTIGESYSQTPIIARIGERIDKYLDVASSAVGTPVDPTNGYRLEDLGGGLYMITDNIYQSMFQVYDGGVVVIDAPPAYATRILLAISVVTDEPVTHIVYSHAHVDHIGGAKALGGEPIIIARPVAGTFLEC